MLNSVLDSVPQTLSSASSTSIWTMVPTKSKCGIPTVTMSRVSLLSQSLTLIAAAATVESRAQSRRINRKAEFTLWVQIWKENSNNLLEQTLVLLRCEERCFKRCVEFVWQQQSWSLHRKPIWLHDHRQTAKVLQNLQACSNQQLPLVDYPCPHSYYPCCHRSLLLLEQKEARERYVTKVFNNFFI